MATTPITDEEFQDSYKAAKEATSSSPSGRHIGHYKAILKDPTLTALHATMMSIPFQVGIVPDRWNRVTDIMLEKTAGDSRCHRLRIIALFKSDLNHAKRILIGRKLLHFIEDNHMLSDMQLGSRPGKRCISAVLKKVLAHDYLCLTKQTAAFVENDATGCYDRLMNNIILMILKKFGIPKTVTSCLGSIWDNTVHLIKTIYGTSHITYNSTPDMPLYGPGQGSMCGPIFWILCYWLIISSLDPSITSAQYISVCKSIIVNMTGISFVDDTGLGVASTYIWDTNLSTEENYREEIRHVVQKIHLLAQHWEKLLFSTGGSINLQKSFWYLVAWNWKNNKATLAMIGQTPVELLLTSGYSTIQEQLPRIEPTQAFKTLGVYILASGCQNRQMEILRTSSQHYYDHIQNSTLSPQEAYTSYALYLRPRLSYPLPCTSLTSSQCRRIQAPALAVLLPNFRLNRHSRRSVLFSGPKYGGLSLPDLYDDQGLGQLMLFIGHIKLGDDTGQLILSTLTHIQLKTGSSRPVFSLSFKVYECLLDPTWITSIWSYVSSIKVTVEIENQWLPTPMRDGDTMLFDQALSLNFTTLQLRQINECRMYLQVIIVSDISTADGKYILPHIYKGKRSTDRISSLHWPATRRPVTWAAWKLFLQHISLGPKLENALGKSIATPHQMWTWFHDPITDVVYHRMANDIWTQYTNNQVS
jgi:hypothetical protein